jgi:glycosyltransferase involved in cell wall biosynthesis
MSTSTAPRVTWLMPVKNGMPFLSETLASIRAQSYPHHELLVWDNGSTDGTRELLESWIPSRIPGTVIANAPLGLGASRAELVKRARTELCACIDADDVNLPQRLEKQVAAMVADPGLAAIGCNPYIVDERGRRLDDWYYPLADAEIRWRTIWQCSLNHSSVMFRREAVLRAGNYRDDLRVGEDLDLWVRLSRVGPMRNSPERLTCYRRHLGNSTTGMTDYYASDLATARMNAGSLFPDLGEMQAMRLWQASYPPAYRDGPQPGLGDLAELKRTANRLAHTLGLANDAFVATEYFRLQRRTMMKTIAKSTLARLGLTR